MKFSVNKDAIKEFANMFYALAGHDDFISSKFVLLKASVGKLNGAIWSSMSFFEFNIDVSVSVEGEAFVPINEFRSAIDFIKLDSAEFEIIKNRLQLTSGSYINRIPVANQFAHRPPLAAESVKFTTKPIAPNIINGLLNRIRGWWDANPRSDKPEFLYCHLVFEPTSASAFALSNGHIAKAKAAVDVGGSDTLRISIPKISVNSLMIVLKDQAEPMTISFDGNKLIFQNQEIIYCAPTQAYSPPDVEPFFITDGLISGEVDGKDFRHAVRSVRAALKDDEGIIIVKFSKDQFSVYAKGDQEITNSVPGFCSGPQTKIGFLYSDLKLLLQKTGKLIACFSRDPRIVVWQIEGDPFNAKYAISVALHS